MWQLAFEWFMYCFHPQTRWIFERSTLLKCQVPFQHYVAFNRIVGFCIVLKCWLRVWRWSVFSLVSKQPMESRVWIMFISTLDHNKEQNLTFQNISKYKTKEKETVTDISIHAPSFSCGRTRIDLFKGNIIDKPNYLLKMIATIHTQTQVWEI